MSDQTTTAGTLIGKVVVDPPNPAPGQPVHIAVVDPGGRALTDAEVTVMGVAGAGGYVQFPSAGSRRITAIAKRDDVVESASATVDVAGTPWAFRPSLANAKVTEIPLLQAAIVPGRPYTAHFTVGSTDGVRRLLAAELVAKDAAQAKDPPAAPAPDVPAPGVPASRVPAAVGTAAPAARALTVEEARAAFVPADAMSKELAAKVASLPAESIRRVQVADPAVAEVGLIAGKLEVTPEATSYEWDFGDNTKAITQSPTVTHDYLDAIRGDTVTHAFNVTCRVAHDNVTVTRTMAMESAYGRCRQLGTIVPPVSGDVYATFQHVGFAGSLIVTNLEDSYLELTAMAVVPLSDSPGFAVPAPSFTTMTAPTVLAANASMALAVYVSLDQLHAGGPDVNGFIVYYHGQVKQAGLTKQVEVRGPVTSVLESAKGAATHLAAGVTHAVEAKLAGEISHPAESVPVRFSHAFRIRMTDSGVVHSDLAATLSGAAWDLSGVREAITATATPVLTSLLGGDVVSDPATRTAAIPLNGRPATPEANAGIQAVVQAGMASIAGKLGAIGRGPVPGRRPMPPQGSARTIDPDNPPPVVEGHECYPDDISDSDAASADADQLVCQATGETQTVTVPGSFQNGLQGDVILSPVPIGGGDLIAALFSALMPPQYHGHSGIMTSNFFEITHCTAAPQRYSDRMNKDIAGIATSLDPDTLRYGWPGAITQSIDDATNDRPFFDPEGKSYTLNSFNTDPQGDMHLVYPLVVKPLPEHEEVVRPTLRAAADLARSKGARYDASGHLIQQGGCYYSFYGYTDPALAAGFTSAAGSEAGWANGLVPAVCSGFVWLCLKEKGIPLVTTNATETLSDFSASARTAGAQVGPADEATSDGLTFYPADERAAAGAALRAMFMSQALSQEGGFGQLFGGAVNEAVAGPIADQLLNDFAFGNPDMIGSSAWQSPGDGNAISPDNITFWNPPYYGYAEPLQYLPQHSETYTVSKWKKVITWGTVTGRVTYNGDPVPNAHVWVYLGQAGGDTHTGADGRYELSHVPVGAYQLKVQAVIPINGTDGEETNGLDGEQIEMTAAHPNLVHDVELHGLPSSYRKLDLNFSISGDHSDWNPWHTHGVQSGGPSYTSIDVNPGQVTKSWTWRWDYDGGGYYTARYIWNLTLAVDLSISVALQFEIVDDGDGSIQYSDILNFNVAVGATWSGWCEISHAGPTYTNGPARLTFSATNNQQTG